jgi:hypothetical protein
MSQINAEVRPAYSERPGLILRATLPSDFVQPPVCGQLQSPVLYVQGEVDYGYTTGVPWGLK